MTDSINLTGIYMVDGVNSDGEPFISVTAHGEGGVILIGQLSPEEIREHAKHYFAVAEAAEQDAAVLRIIRKLGIQEVMAGMIITELRESREAD